MTVRNPAIESVQSWTGFDTWNDPFSLTTQQWVDSSNVVIETNGNAIALRSPANFNNVTLDGTHVISGEYYDRQAGGVVVFDQLNGAGTGSYSTTGTTNTGLAGVAENAPWQSLNVNNCLYRANGTEMVQIFTNLTTYPVGIPMPAAAPAVSLVGGGAGSFTVGVTVSYAYRNSTTGHVGQCSDASATTGPGGTKLRVATVASILGGVDGIVLFITEDGGSIRYLFVDANGDPHVYSNATANIDISIDTIMLAGGVFSFDYDTQETSFNTPPPANISNISRWKNRIIGVLPRYIVYSGFDQIAYGVPWECWPALNVITIPNKGEMMQGGIETPLGWLGLSDRNAYLLTGTPSDQVDSGQNTLQVTSQFNQLGWGLGTRSPLTIASCPYGTVWLDQDKHLQFWPWSGNPTEICLGLRADLATIQDSAGARSVAQMRWFPSGQQAGFFVLTASTAGTTENGIVLNDRVWIITVMNREGSLFIAGAPSDIAAQCLVISRISGTVRCLIGVVNRLRQILDFSLAGVGWASTQSLYFEMVCGNQIGIYDRFHSIQYDATDSSIQPRTSDLDNTKIKVMSPQKRNGTYFAMANRYGTRHKLRFTFPKTDDTSREVKNCRLVYGRKQRLI